MSTGGAEIQPGAVEHDIGYVAGRINNNKVPDDKSTGLAATAPPIGGKSNPGPIQGYGGLGLGPVVAGIGTVMCNPTQAAVKIKNVESDTNLIRSLPLHLLVRGAMDSAKL